MKFLPHLIRKLTILALLPLATLAANAQSAYDKATAGQPMYDNKEVWPKLTGKERFLAQKYEDGRVLTWAKPGEGVGGRGGLDVFDPQNWLLNGKTPTAAELVFDEKTDFVFPDSETPYKIDFIRIEGWPSLYRNVTVGRNAEMRDKSLKYYGNLWVKKGGVVFGSHGNSFYGGDTFIREDNGTWDDARSGRIGQYFTVRKPSPETSVEIIGAISFLDRMPIESGTVIVSQDSRLSPGRNASMILSKGATLVLLDGARFVKWANQISQLDALIFGKVQGGLPERPLTRPAYFDLSCQNTTLVKFFDRLTPPSQNADLENRITSVVFAGSSEIETISAAPEGMLHLRYSGIDPKDWHLRGDAAYGAWVKTLSAEDSAYFTAQLDAIPRKVTAMFQPGAKVNGLVLNDFHADGILMEAPGEAEKWQNVRLGTGNDADLKGMIVGIARASVVNSTKNPGGDYQLGAPKSFATQDYSTKGEMQAEKLSATVPAEAKGYKVGIRFTNAKSPGWCRVDNVSLKADGNEQIENGTFEKPVINEEKGKRVPLTQVPGWNPMAKGSGNLGLSKLGESQVCSTISSDAAFGQTTKYVAKGGEALEFAFDVLTEGDAAIRVEIFYLEK